MSPDQIYHRLCDIKVLKAKGGRRIAKADPLSVTVDENGMVKGRDADGNPIEARIGGKSLARRLMEEEKAKQQAPKERRRRHRG